MNDGAHVYQADSVRPTSPTASWEAQRDDLDRQVRPGAFSMVLTNPPFGENLILSLVDGQREGYSFSHRWKRDAKTGSWWPEPGEWQDRQLGLIFLERSLALLAPDGRLGIVLPETFLFSREFEWLVDYLTRTVTIEHVLNLPMVTFEEFCRAKTCLVFLRKRAPAPNHQIVFSYPESIGLDRHGKIRFAVQTDGTISDQVDDELADAMDELTESQIPDVTVAAPTKYRIPVPQSEVAAKRILLPQYYWRSPMQTAFDGFCRSHNCGCITLGDLEAAGFISARSGHGSPSPAFHGKGPIPYIKVINITNWRIAEKSAYGVPEAVAARLWGKNGPDLVPYEIITPNRASRTIGRWAVIMPWQLRLLLTKEFLRLRVADPLPADPTGGLLTGFNWAFLLYALSLQVVIDQYRYLVFMQTNREDLGLRWREVTIPLPYAGLATWSDPVHEYFDGLVRAKMSRDQFLPETGHDLADWPL